jgi:hypothetical protein
MLFCTNLDCANVIASSIGAGDGRVVAPEFLSIEIWMLVVENPEEPRYRTVSRRAHPIVEGYANSASLLESGAELLPCDCEVYAV